MGSTLKPKANRRQVRDRRARGRGGRRKGDSRSPWWRRGIVLAVIGLALRCLRPMRKRKT